MENLRIETYTDAMGRRFEYALRTYGGAEGLGVHFSAFFDRINIPGLQQREFAGYFHRLRMLGDHSAHNWLFLCDPYGSAKNGTFYTGEKGDFFVEDAVNNILRAVWEKLEMQPTDTVVGGSSAGGTAALKFGLMHGMRGIFAIGPHIDLDICAARSARYDNVAFACPDGDPLAEHNWTYTRQVRNLIEAWDPSRPLPRLFVQSCLDDYGVYDEQIIPFIERWTAKGGIPALDIREEGGHTSEFATAPLLHDVVDRLFDGGKIDVVAYQGDPRYAPAANSRRTAAVRRARKSPLLRPALRVASAMRRVAADGWRATR